MVVSLYIEGATSPDMLAYGRVILDQLQHQSAPAFFYFVRRLMQLGHMHQASVLDIGCGYGWTSAAIALLGANTVTANDIRPGMIQAILGRTSELRKDGLDLQVHPLLGDICETELPGESFDAIVTVEAIEHIRDLNSLFAQCARLLRPGGRCVLADTSNALNLRLRSSTHRMWKLRDSSWAFVREQQRLKPQENTGRGSLRRDARIHPYRASPRAFINGRGHFGGGHGRAD